MRVLAEIFPELTKMFDKVDDWQGIASRKVSCE